MTTEETSVSGLKSQVCGLVSGRQAGQCTKTTEANVECVGRACGHEMEVSVPLGRETPPEEPDCLGAVSRPAQALRWQPCVKECVGSGDMTH